MLCAFAVLQLRCRPTCGHDLQAQAGCHPYPRNNHLTSRRSYNLVISHGDDPTWTLTLAPHLVRRPPPRAPTPPEVIEAREREKELKELDRDTRTVFAYNLNLKADERDLFEFFSQAGEVRLLWRSNLKFAQKCTRTQRSLCVGAVGAVDTA